jgi:hypothetical protein
MFCVFCEVCVVAPVAVPVDPPPSLNDKAAPLLIERGAVLTGAARVDREPLAASSSFDTSPGDRAAAGIASPPEAPIAGPGAVTVDDAADLGAAEPINPVLSPGVLAGVWSGKALVTGSQAASGPSKRGPNASSMAAIIPAFKVAPGQELRYSARAAAVDAGSKTGSNTLMA